MRTSSLCNYNDSHFTEERTEFGKSDIIYLELGENRLISAFKPLCFQQSRAQLGDKGLVKGFLRQPLTS